MGSKEKPAPPQGGRATGKWLLRALAVLLLATAAVDWSRLAQSGDRLVTDLSNTLKVAMCFVTVLIAYSAPPAVPEDKGHYRLVFALILSADVCFVTGLEPVGIAIFGVVQSLLTARNLRGWRTARLGQHAASIAAVGALVSAVLALTTYGVYAAQGVTPLLIAIGVYMVLLALSTTSAWASRYIGRVPVSNANVLTAGMVCFVLCDATVAGNLILPTTETPYVITSSLTWMFYAPALLLIAASAWQAPVQLLKSVV